MDLSGVSFLSGFAAGVGIGLFVSCFDAACDKKQEADVPAAAGVFVMAFIVPTNILKGC